MTVYGLGDSTLRRWALRPQLNGGPLDRASQVEHEGTNDLLGSPRWRLPMKAIRMRAVVRGFTVIGACSTALAPSGCGLFGPSAEHFLIPVDSIAVPSIVAATDTLTARFYGGRRPDGWGGLAPVGQQGPPANTGRPGHGVRPVGR